MKKERIYLTDITLHLREYRQTANFSKAAQKGRMYSPLPPQDARVIDTEAITTEFKFQLPSDLQKRLSQGKIEIMVPNDGLMIYAGRDVIETTESMRKQAHRKDVHDKWGKKSWLDRKKSI